MTRIIRFSTAQCRNITAFLRSDEKEIDQKIRRMKEPVYVPSERGLSDRLPAIKGNKRPKFKVINKVKADVEKKLTKLIIDGSKNR